MSVESARAFLDRMFKDKAFYEKISSIPTDEGKMEAAHAAGYVFDRADAEKLIPAGLTFDQLRHLDPKSDEIPDALLEAVAGGKGGDDGSWNQAAIVGTAVGGAGLVVGIVGASLAAAAL